MDSSQQGHGITARTRTVTVGGVRIGTGHPLVLIAGPCVIESREGCMDLARRLKDFAGREGVPLIFKASYDKANRSSVRSYRGPGLEEGLRILREGKAALGLPILTDVHAVEDVGPASETADILQVPAFLCRQTDLLIEAGRSGRPVNVKKGQFLAPGDMRNVVDKIRSTGNEDIVITERGTSFGYHNLVVDMRSLPLMREMGYPVVFDATHSVQLPGGAGDRSGGEGRWAPPLARAAVAAGCDGIFAETHVCPEQALCDRDNALPLAELSDLWRTLRRLDEIAGR